MKNVLRSVMHQSANTKHVHLVKRNAFVVGANIVIIVLRNALNVRYVHFFIKKRLYAFR